MNRAGAAFIVAVSVFASACGATNAPGTPVAHQSPGGSASPAASHSAGPSTLPSLSAGPTVPAQVNSAFDILPPAGGPPANPSPITCVGAIGPSDPVAVVQLHSGVIVLRDYIDPLHPRSACQFTNTVGSVAGVQLIDANHLVLGGPDYLYAVIDVPDVHYRWFQLPNPANEFPTFLAVSPALDEIAWWSADLAGNFDLVHITSRTGDHVVASLPDPHGGRCGGPDDSKLGAYTHSSGHLFVLDNADPSETSLVVVRGTQIQLSVAPPASGWHGVQPGMAVWSSTTETLYYRQQGDVWKWVPGSSPQRFLAGVPWQYPTISPDGSHLAYAVARADGTHNVYLIDLAHAGGAVMIGKGPRNLPVFLDATQLWYKSESQGICGPGGNQPLIYDLSDGTEAASVIDQTFAVWPATSSNF